MESLRNISSPRINYSGKRQQPNQPEKASKVVIIVPQIRIPRNLYCEIDEAPDNTNRDNPDWDDLTDIGFLDHHPEYKPRKTWTPPGYGDDD